MSAIDKLIEAMQRAQLSFQRLARESNAKQMRRYMDAAPGAQVAHDCETEVQRGVAQILGDMIRLGAELRAAETVCAPWTCLGCEKQHCGRQYRDSSGSEPFCGPCLGLS